MYPTIFRRIVCLAVLAAGAAYLLHRAEARAADPTPAATLGKQEVAVEIDDAHGLAVTTVRQDFSNPAWETREGVCPLPISGEAAMLRFTVLSPAPRKGERQEALGALQPAGRGLFRAIIHHVPGRGHARFELVYAEPLARRGRRRKYVYPIPSPERGAVPLGINARVTIHARSRPEEVGCATHHMLLFRPAPHNAVLSYDSNRPPDGRDLVVDYETAAGVEDGHSHLAVLTPADSSQDPYFLLTLPPPAALLHGSGRGEAPADIVFCLDVSGSTRGRKLNTIQEAVHDGLTDLQPRDRFGVVAFDDDARPFRRGLVSADKPAVAQALRFVNRLRPGAGSDPTAGLRAALGILGEHRARGRRAVIAMVVDHGAPADLAARVSALDLRHLQVRVVALGAQADARLVSLRVSGKKLKPGPAVSLSRAVLTYGPALGGAALDPGALNASYVYPSPGEMPSLPLSSPVLLFGRLNQAPPVRGTVSLTGIIEGKKQTLKSDYAWEPLSPATPVRALWAGRRLRRLAQLAAQGGDDAEELADAEQRVRAEGGLVLAPGR